MLKGGKGRELPSFADNSADYMEITRVHRDSKH